MSDQTTEIQAAVFRKLLQHLEENTQVQNIDLMNLAGFCRNCLAKWYMAESNHRGETLDYEKARELIYGMPYDTWKEKHQTPATPDQMARFNQKPSTESSH